MNTKEIANYKIIKELGKGSFGIVYEALNLNTNQVVALKLEESFIEKSQLENEYKVYSELQGKAGIATIYYFGKFNNSFYLTMAKLGPSLAEIHIERKHVTLKSICMIAKRIIKIIEEIHKKDYIYRDMKPDNILTMGRSLYLIDFGMCKKYKINGEHIPMINNKVLTGTARYASINTHKGYEQARRDDLEGFFYVLIYLIKGDLPWMGIPAPTRKEKYAKIGEVKEKVSVHSLCKDLPSSNLFEKYINYVRSLEFESKPDYKYLLKIFDDILKKNGLKDDDIFDWVDIPVNENKKKKGGFWNGFSSMFK